MSATMHDFNLVLEVFTVYIMKEQNSTYLHSKTA